MIPSPKTGGLLAGKEPAQAKGGAMESQPKPGEASPDLMYASAGIQVSLPGPSHCYGSGLLVFTQILRGPYCGGVVSSGQALKVLEVEENLFLESTMRMNCEGNFAENHLI